MEKHGSPTFHEMLSEMSELHMKKSHDYASDENPYGNYHFAGLLATLFAHSHEDAGFVSRIGEKIYRLANLEKGNKTPKNESIEDTERDIAVITVLWMASRRDRRKPVITAEKLQTFIDDDMKILGDSVPGQMVPVKPTDKLPEICTDCNMGFSDQKIQHAIIMHGAEFNKAQCILKYPTRGMYLLTSGFWKEEKL